MRYTLSRNPTTELTLMRNFPPILYAIPPCLMIGVMAALADNERWMKWRRHKDRREAQRRHALPWARSVGDTCAASDVPTRAVTFTRAFTGEPGPVVCRLLDPPEFAAHWEGVRRG